MVYESNYRDKLIIYECNYRNKIDIKMHTINSNNDGKT